MSRTIIEGPVDNGESSHDLVHVGHGWSLCSVMLQLLPIVIVIDVGNPAVGLLVSPPQPKSLVVGAKYLFPLFTCRCRYVRREGGRSL